MPPRAPSAFQAILWVARKELLTSLRDRQTLLYTVVLPICMYPILFWGMIQVFLVVQGKRQHTQVEVGLLVEEGRVEPQELRRALQNSTPDTGEEAQAPGIESVELRALGAELSRTAIPEWMRGEDSRAGEESKAERPDAVLVLARADDEPPHTVLFHDSTEGLSQIAQRRVSERLPLLREDLRAKRAEELGRDPGELDPMVIESHDLAPEHDRGALVLSMILPMLLVFMCFLGAFFPAVDLTAGEKERGCAETTLLLPVPRTAVHLGKILAVGTTAVLATALNLIAIGFSARHLLSALGPAAQIDVRFPITGLIAIMPFALLFAFFVSAVLTSVAGLASSFKEGQALLGPAQMLFIVPAMGGVMPGLELTPALAFVPVLDIVLAFKAILLGKLLVLEYALTALASLIYAAAAILFAMRMLSRESLWISGRGFPLSRLWRLWRSQGGVR